MHLLFYNLLLHQFLHHKLLLVYSTLCFPLLPVTKCLTYFLSFCASASMSHRPARQQVVCDVMQATYKCVCWIYLRRKHISGKLESCWVQRLEMLKYETLLLALKSQVDIFSSCYVCHSLTLDRSYEYLC